MMSSGFIPKLAVGFGGSADVWGPMTPPILMPKLEGRLDSNDGLGIHMGLGVPFADRANQVGVGSTFGFSHVLLGRAHASSLQLDASAFYRFRSVRSSDNVLFHASGIRAALFGEMISDGSMGIFFRPWVEAGWHFTSSDQFTNRSFGLAGGLEAGLVFWYSPNQTAQKPKTIAVPKYGVGQLTRGGLKIVDQLEPDVVRAVRSRRRFIVTTDRRVAAGYVKKAQGDIVEKLGARLQKIADREKRIIALQGMMTIVIYRDGYCAYDWHDSFALKPFELEDEIRANLLKSLSEVELVIDDTKPQTRMNLVLNWRIKPKINGSTIAQNLM